MLEGGFGVFELLLAAEVAVFEDEAAGLGEVVLGGLPGIGFGVNEEAGAVEVDVGQVERHGAALGDFPGFVEVALRAVGAGGPAGEAAQPGAGEEAAGEMILRAGAAEKSCSSPVTKLGSVRPSAWSVHCCSKVKRCCWMTWKSAVFSGSRRA